MPADQGSAIATEGMDPSPCPTSCDAIDQETSKQSDVAEVKPIANKGHRSKVDASPKLRVQFNVPPQTDIPAPKPCRKRKHKLKKQIEVVVKDLEKVVSELSSVVVELRGVLVQIERVSTELDASLIGKRTVKVNKVHHRNHMMTSCLASDSSQERLDSPELLRMSARMRRRISAKSRRCSALGSKPKSESESSLATESSPRKEIVGPARRLVRKTLSEDGSHQETGGEESDYGTKSDAESFNHRSFDMGSCASSTRHTPATSDVEGLSNAGNFSDFEIVVSPELALRSEFLMRSPAMSRMSMTSCSDGESCEFHADYNRDINTWTTYALVHDAPSNSDAWDSDREVCV